MSTWTGQRPVHAPHDRQVAIDSASVVGQLGIRVARLLGVEPGPDEIGAALGRLERITGHLVGGTHHLGVGVVMAQTIAVAVEGRGELATNRHRDGAIGGGAAGDVIEAEQRVGLASVTGPQPIVRGHERAVQLARVEAVGGVECRLDRPHHRDGVGVEELVDDGAAQAATVFSPQQTAVGGNEIDHVVGERCDQRFVVGTDRIERGTDVDATDVGVPEHGVVEAVSIEQRPEVRDERRHGRDRYGTVLDERRWPRSTVGNSGQQANGVGSDLPDRGPIAVIAHDRDVARPPLPLQLLDHGRDVGPVVVTEQDGTDRSRRGRSMTQATPEGGPARRGPTSFQGGAVADLEGARPRRCEVDRVAERSIEVGIGRDHQRRHGRYRAEAKRRPHDDSQGAFGTADDRDGVDEPIVMDPRDAVAGEAARQLGETDGRGLLQLQEQSPDPTDSTGPIGLRLGRRP